MKRLYILISVIFLVFLNPGCTGGSSDNSDKLVGLAFLQYELEQSEKNSGGTMTVYTATSYAFSLPASNLTDDEEEMHTDGDTHFETEFVNHDDRNAADQNGVGPVFNNNSCVGCHIRDGRGKPETGTSHNTMLFKISQIENGNSVNPTTGAPYPIPYYGTQLGDSAVYGYSPEGKVSISYTTSSYTFSDGEVVEMRTPVYTFQDLYDSSNWPSSDNLMYSPRVAPPVFGRGLIEAIPDADIAALADENDENGDGISGKVQWVTDPETSETRAGRFALKGENPTIRAQHAGAYLQDMGVTSSIFSTESCMEAGTQPQCAGDSVTTEPEISDESFDLVVFYVQTLGVPARRNMDKSGVGEGKATFNTIGCSSCHVARFVTSSSESYIRPVRNQTIYPYSDFLLHDMGDGLADNRPVFNASGSEWKTPPLWGLGLTGTVSGHTMLLHDGRAQSITEDILWHGGEAESAKTAFTSLSKTDRDNLLAFLRSL